jgi:hypothetical protein
MKDARPDGILDGMTAIIADEAPVAGNPSAPGKVRCDCGALVEPTRAGGQRPRPHLRPDTQEPCRIVHPTETLCKRCGGAYDSPVDGCTSNMFHPATWWISKGGRREVGNAAAAGEILGLSGEYFVYICRRYAPGHPSRPPQPIGHDMNRRCNYWDLDKVRLFRDKRPGKNLAAHREPEPSEPSE